MKNKKLKLIGSIVLAALGAALVITAIFTDFNKNINGVMTGIGAGLFGAALSQIAAIMIYSKNPDKLKQKTIEVNDERNILIVEKAKATTYKIFTYILSAVLIALIVINLKPIWLFAAISLYVIRFIIEIFFVNKYAKEL